MKIYTKTGDKGDTSLFGGKRVSKADIRIEAYGTLDELNAHIGVLREACIDYHEILTELLQIQSQLFSIGSLLANEGKTSAYIPAFESDNIILLEEHMDAMDSQLSPLTNFILPGGNTASAFCHVARTVCRRAERRLVDLATRDEVEENLIVYLNRLSDYFFVLGRYLCYKMGSQELLWHP